MNLPRSVLAISRIHRILACALCFVAPVQLAKAAEVLYLANPGNSSPTNQQIETAARFYGLSLDIRFISSSKQVSAAQSAITNPGTLALIIDAEALPSLDHRQILSITRRGQQRIPILIAGINERANPALLKLWSDGAVDAAQRLESVPSGWNEVGPSNDITRQLSGSRLPLGRRPFDYLVLGAPDATERLIEAKLGSLSLPVFIRTRNGDQEIFFAAEVPQADTTVTPDPYRQQPVFAEIASPLMFLRHAGGDHAWHSPGDYANFTIDDLWLREPYGHVRFRSLLEHAQQHNFHATIAFIPWNFDRSQPALVQLFQAHSDRLSICIHGNNHVHQEFGPIDDHPVNEQTHNIYQSLARMERFKQLTKLSYDPVMVFPHSVSPEQTFAVLKRANFLATANSLNVPSDARTPPDAGFALRTASLDFANFPSLRRYSAESEIPRTQLAIDAFLGNPMLFYAHEGYFATGINAFDRLADLVNQLQPGIQWRSLGDIAQHLYLERLRADGDVDIRALSSSIRLLNTYDRDANFVVEKDETFDTPVTVLVDGQAYPFERAGNRLKLELPITLKSSRLVEVRYGGAGSSEVVDIGKHSPKVAAIRLLSDFRDNAVANSSLGRWFIRSYVASGAYWNRVVVILGAVLALILFVLYHRRVRNPALTASIHRSSSGSN